MKLFGGGAAREERKIKEAQDRKRTEIRDEVARIRAGSEALHLEARQLKIIADILLNWAKGGDTTPDIDDCTLVETRVQGGVVGAGASMPINLMGIRLHVGGGVPVKREVMTEIDSGTFTIGRDSAHFVGGRQSRKWEYKNVLGYDASWSDQLLIAVSNRQKMSGIRYSSSMDVLIEPLLVGAIELFRGNKAKVSDWLRESNADLEKRLADFDARSNATFNRLSGELEATGVPEEEADEFVVTTWTAGSSVER